jgi:SAM-dependent methyltransferase
MMPDHIPSDDGADESNLSCRICGGKSLGRLDAREMMLGLRNRFLYLECPSCGCVQIARYPADIDKYYPENYYSYQDTSLATAETGRAVVKRAKWLIKALLINRSTATRRRFLESDDTRAWLESRPVVQLYLQNVPDPRSRILDVGCGSGGLLGSLYYLYYENVHGIDPYIERDIYLGGRLLVRKTHLRDLDSFYDFISFNHVFEHMPDQRTVLKGVGRVLAPNGHVMIRIPVAGGAAWRAYRENWVQLDPPRHFYLHSENSFRLLVEAAGFDVVSIDYDSNGLQFWGSELYLRDIPLMDPRSPARSKESVFSSEALADYESRAAALNEARDGDQIVAILRIKK